MANSRELSQFGRLVEIKDGTHIGIGTQSDIAIGFGTITAIQVGDSNTVYYGDGSNLSGVSASGGAGAASTAHINAETLNVSGISTFTGTINGHAIPSGSGTFALTSDVPTNNNQLTNGAGYITGYTVTESDVTTHQAALSITESQISDLGTYLTSSDLSSYATTSYVDTEVAGLVDSAPGTLNTLNELAAALGDDANFSTTVTNSIATKLPLAGGTMTGNITFASGQTFDYNNLTNTPTIPTNNNQLTNGAGYVTANTQLSNEQVQDIVGAMVSGNSESGITVTYQDGDGTLDFSVTSQTDQNFTTTLKNKLDGIESGATADQSSSEILTAIKTVDGASSGLDADLLDGQHGSYYKDTPSGTVAIFYQSSAPTGWTKSTSHDNKALRVVSGNGGGSGGSNNFTTAFNSSRGTSGGSVNNHTLSTSQMPSHQHHGRAPNHDSNSSGSQGYPYNNNHNAFRTSDRARERQMHIDAIESTGGGGSHNHGFSNPSINLNVQYINVIICSRNS